MPNKSNPEFDEFYGRFMSKPKFELSKKFMKKMYNHFKRGLMQNTLPATLQISESTHKRWKKHNPTYVEMIALFEPLSKLATDKLSLECATGERPRANAFMISKRMERILDKDESKEDDDNIQKLMSIYQDIIDEDKNNN